MRGSCSVATAGVLGESASWCLFVGSRRNREPDRSGRLGRRSALETKHRSALAKRALAPGGAPVRGRVPRTTCASIGRARARTSWAAVLAPDGAPGAGGGGEEGTGRIGDAEISEAEPRADICPWTYESRIVDSVVEMRFRSQRCSFWSFVERAHLAVRHQRLLGPAVIFDAF